jgi:RNA polymerase sigma-70 factor (ECF subfamily)
MLSTHEDSIATQAPPPAASGGPAQSIDAEELFRGHATFVASFLRRLGASPDEVDDLVQEVFLVAHRRGGFVPGAAKPRSWLAEIAVRVCSSARRKGRQRQAGFAPAEIEPATTPDGVFNRVAALEALVRVQQALDAMDLEHRIVFLLANLDGASGESIAAAMGIPVGTVHSRLHRARRVFRDAYERLAREERPSTSQRLRTVPPDRRRDDEVRVFLAAGSASFDAAKGLARLRAAVGPGAPSAAITVGGMVKVLVSSIAVGAASAMVCAAVMLPRAEVTHAPAPPQVQHTTATATASPVENAPSETVIADVVTGAEAPTSAIASTDKPSRAVELPSGHQPQARKSTDGNDAVMAEVQQVAQLRSLAESNPAAALTLADEGNRTFVRGLLRQEREAIAVASLVRLGQRAEARTRAQSFLATYPRGPFAARVRSLIGIDDGAVSP